MRLCSLISTIGRRGLEKKQVVERAKVEKTRERLAAEEKAAAEVETELVGVGRQIEAHRLDMLERERAKEKGGKEGGVGERDVDVEEGTVSRGGMGESW